jgi:hypothetical protein
MKLLRIVWNKKKLNNTHVMNVNIMSNIKSTRKDTNWLNTKELRVSVINFNDTNNDVNHKK